MEELPRGRPPVLIRMVLLPTAPALCRNPVIFALYYASYHFTKCRPVAGSVIADQYLISHFPMLWSWVYSSCAFAYVIVQMALVALSFLFVRVAAASAVLAPHRNQMELGLSDAAQLHTGDLRFPNSLVGQSIGQFGTAWQTKRTRKPECPHCTSHFAQSTVEADELCYLSLVFYACRVHRVPHWLGLIDTLVPFFFVVPSFFALGWGCLSPRPESEGTPRHPRIWLTFASN